MCYCHLLNWDNNGATFFGVGEGRTLTFPAGP